ncbi:MAG: FAD-dependent oxidoreductase [Firmicutes bacterium]|nr:FAD-dependent oxidoreductase [Bacillota bacterium]
MEFKSYDIEKDLVIVGGGMPGICAAIQAARLGLTVALINNRGYLGGNASAEIFVTVNGATGSQEFNLFARESGIVEEILLENLYRNRQGNRYIWDTVLLDFVGREPNIELFHNTNIDKAEMADGSAIKYVSGVQSTTEKRFNIYGKYFLDDTGDGTLGYLSGAEFRKGREASSEFDEKIAPEKADKYVLPSTLCFYAKDVGEPVEYIPPDFALDIAGTDILEYREIPQEKFYSYKWFYEIGGELDQISDNEEIIQRHRALVYGVWDYIKNTGKYDAENYDLEYVSSIPGKRESRRLVGDYILKESDIKEQKDFEDTVGYGGWSIDLHAVEGFFSKEPINSHIVLKGIYQIPYRTGYSKNVGNLFMSGRCMSTTHVAFGSTRVISTLSILAQANAVAAYLCKKHDTTPRGIYDGHLQELQSLLMKNDGYVVGRKYSNENDLAQQAKINVSSVRQCRLTEMGSSAVLEKNLAFIVPVKEYIKNIQLLVKSNSNEKLNYTIYQPKKKENYCPEMKISEGSIEVEPSSKFNWVTLPIEKSVNQDKLFIEIEANKQLEIAFSDDVLPGFGCMIKNKGQSPRSIDIDTLQPKEFLYCNIANVPCFKMFPEQEIFGADNLTNGYLRPYGLPNIWISDAKVDGEHITVQFDSAKSISEIVLTFDSNLNYRIFNIRSHDFNTLPQIVKDYTVYYRNGTDYAILYQVTGNFQRVSGKKFDKIETQELKIVFHATNGASNVGVYGISIY